jgi:hypothetical protein
MPDDFHKTVPVQVWVDIDSGIAEMVRYLNTIPGVRTHASCQGTIGEGGAAPYRPQVMVTWSDEVLERLRREFDVTMEGDHFGYLHPREDFANTGMGSGSSGGSDILAECRAKLKNKEEIIRKMRVFISVAIALLDDEPTSIVLDMLEKADDASKQDKP